MKFKKVISVVSAAAMLAALIPASYIIADSNGTGQEKIMQLAASSEYMADPINQSTTNDFENTSKSFEERAADMVSRMTLEEKVAQLTARSAPAISRLGLPSYNYWKEGIHGMAREGKATSFPVSLAMSNTWDTELMQKTMDITGKEARANAPQSPKGKGLNYWNPTINLLRDPRWGRNEEGYGEDPYLTSQMGIAAVNGMQGNDEKYLQVIATPKHFAANNAEGERQSGTSEMSETNFRDYYTRTFKDVVENSDPYAVMTSYNGLTITRDGNYLTDYIASSANKYLVTDLLTRTWGFNGFVVGDCGAWQNTFGKEPLKQKLYPDVPFSEITNQMAIAKVLEAGSDRDCNQGEGGYGYAYQAVTDGLVDEALVDRAVYDAILARMYTGEFDEDVAYRDISTDVIESDEHVAVATESAEKSWVLLENKNNTLPLQNTVSNIAVVGPLADAVTLGDYSGSPTKTSTPIDGIKSAVSALNSDAQVNLLGSVADDTALFNIKSINLVLNDGKKRSVDLATATNVRGATLDGGQLKNVKKTASIEIPDVDFGSVASIEIESSSVTTPMPTVVVNIGYETASQIAGTVTLKSTSGADVYDTATNVYNGATGGYTSKTNMYLTFNVSSEFSVDGYKDALDAADYIIAYAGTTLDDSSESHDRGSINLPDHEAHVQAICNAYPDKTIVVMSTVGQINVEPFKDKCVAMLWTSYNGQSQGEALGNVLTGIVNPSGKLTTTWYTNEDLTKMPLDSQGGETINDIKYQVANYNLQNNAEFPGRTYMYYNGDAVYDFGYGLSYTTYSYSNITIDKTDADANDTVTVTADVTNTGTVQGEEVVQLYVSVPGGDGTKLPIKQLKGFKRVALEPNETKTVTFELNIADTYFFDEVTLKNYVVNGEYAIYVGGTSDLTQCQTTSVNVTGTLSNGVKNIVTNPLGLKLVAATVDGANPTPANSITADASVALDDDTLVYDFEENDIVVTYASSDTDVATVDENGVVTAGTKEGSALITASATKDGKTVTDSFPVVTMFTDKVADSVIEKYISDLDAEFAKYNAPAYSAEDWAQLSGVYEEAKTAMQSALLETDLINILDTAKADMSAFTMITLTDSYTVNAEDTDAIQNGRIDYRANTTVGEYTATETEITGTYTASNPLKLQMKLYEDNTEVTEQIFWSVERLDSSSRTPATIGKNDGILSIASYGVYKITGNCYANGKKGEMIVHANLQLEGEMADSANGADLTDEKNGASGGLNAGSTASSWMQYKGIKLAGLESITFRTSNNNASPSKLYASLSSATDTSFAEGEAVVTGDWNKWSEVTVKVNRNYLEKTKLDENGCTNIYICTNAANLDYVQFNYIDSTIDIIDRADGKVDVIVPCESGILMAAAYTDGTLSALRTQDITAENNTYTFDGFTDGDTVKFLVWKDLSSMVPIAKAPVHTYYAPDLKSLMVWNLSDPAFDEFTVQTEGTKIETGTGLDGYSIFDNAECSYTYQYGDKTLTLTRAMKGGSGNTKKRCFYFTPEMNGTVTVLFSANTERYVTAEQNGVNLGQMYGIGDKTVTAFEFPVTAGSPAYVYGGGSNKSIYAIIFDAEKEYVAPTPRPTDAPTPTQAPLEEAVSTSKSEVESYSKIWPEAASKLNTTTSVTEASGGAVVDNTRNNTLIYMGAKELTDIAWLKLFVGTKESGQVTVDVYAVDVSGKDISTMSQDAATELAKSGTLLGSQVLTSGSSWNDIKEYAYTNVSGLTGEMGIFIVGTTTGKYVGNFDYMEIGYLK